MPTEMIPGDGGVQAPKARDDAQNKSWRKGLAGGWALLHVLRYGIVGVFCTLMGLIGVVVWCTRPSEWRILIAPTILILLGLGLLGLARRVARHVKSIPKE